MPRVVDSAEDFTVIGENIHATRAVLRNGRRAVTLDDGTEAVTFRDELGERRRLTVPNWFKETQPYSQGQIKHVLIAMMKGIGDDPAERDEGAVLHQGRGGAPDQERGGLPGHQRRRDPLRRRGTEAGHEVDSRDRAGGVHHTPVRRLVAFRDHRRGAGRLRWAGGQAVAELGGLREDRLPRPRPKPRRPDQGHGHGDGRNAIRCCRKGGKREGSTGTRQR